MSENCQSRRTRLVSASILIVAAVVVSILYFTLPPTWLTQLCELLFFPAIAAIAGGLAIVWAGELVVNRWLERYKERSGYGLAKRKVFFSGDDEMIRDVRNDLLLSDLINRKNYTDPNIDLHHADIAILCISKDDDPEKKKDSDKPRVPKDGPAQKEDPDKPEPPKDNPAQKEDPDKPRGHQDDTAQITDWQSKARKTIETVIDQLNWHQALIVFTNGRLDSQTMAAIAERSFSTLVNCRGRIVSDIHSLLTTLPPRNGD